MRKPRSEPLCLGRVIDVQGNPLGVIAANESRPLSLGTPWLLRNDNAHLPLRGVRAGTKLGSEAVLLEPAWTPVLVFVPTGTTRPVVIGLPFVGGGGGGGGGDFLVAMVFFSL